MQGIFSKSILRELSAKRKSSNVSKSVVGLRHLTRKFYAICIILSVNSELLKFCSNLASCITSSQRMECRETPCKPASAAVRCLKPIKDLDLRLAAFNNNSPKMDFEKIPCTSANARKHIGHIINNSYGYKQMPA